jgi:hypothetical protein
MSASFNQGARTPANGAEAMDARLFRVMCWTVALVALASAAFEPWRVTTGLALGGALALINHHWLRTSVRAAFSSSSVSGARPKLSAMRFVLRYFVVTASVVAAYEFGIVSIVATLVGLSAFVVAGVAEGFVQTYFIFARREEN